MHYRTDTVTPAAADRTGSALIDDALAGISVRHRDRAHETPGLQVSSSSAM
jgi:hypothetical protein